jgi:hypothetical protein
VRRLAFRLSFEACDSAKRSPKSLFLNQKGR